MSIYSSTRAYPYAYILTHKETGEFYIGYRQKNVRFKRPSSDDLGIYYFSSSRKIKEIGFENFHCKILAEFYNGDDAWLHEQRLIEANVNNVLMLNLSYFKVGAKKFTKMIDLAKTFKHQEELKLRKINKQLKKELAHKISKEKNALLKEQRRIASIKTPEQKSEITKKRLNSLANRSKEDKELTLKKLQSTLDSRTIEQRNSIIQKCKTTRNAITNAEKQQRKILAHIRRSKKPKEEQKNSRSVQKIWDERSIEQRKIISNNIKKTLANRSPDKKIAISKACSKRKSSKWFLEFEDNKTPLIIHSLTEWCLEHNLSYPGCTSSGRCKNISKA